MFGLIKKILIGLLSSIANVSNYTKCVKQSKMYYSTYKLDKCVGSCNTLNDLSNKVFIPNEREDLNLSVFNMITGINESKTLTKHISCDCKCKSIQWCNNNKCWSECKKIHICEQYYVWNPATRNCESGKYLARYYG